MSDRPGKIWRQIALAEVGQIKVGDILACKSGPLLVTDFNLGDRPASVYFRIRNLLDDAAPDLREVLANLSREQGARMSCQQIENWKP